MRVSGDGGGRCRGKRGTSLNTAVLVSDPAGLSCFFGLGLYARCSQSCTVFPSRGSALDLTLGGSCTLVAVSGEQK